MTELFEKLENLRKNNKNKPHVLLDVDETLICTMTSDEKKSLDDEHLKLLQNNFKNYNMDSYYIVHERPNLQIFLDYLFKHFHVSIWTAASLNYVLTIIKESILIDNTNRKLNHLFHWDHCKDCDKKFSAYKQIEHLRDTYGLNEFDESSILIDDRDDNSEQKNLGHGHHIKAFSLFDDDGKFDKKCIHDNEFDLYSN